MQEAYLKSADPTQSLEAEIDNEMQADLETAGPSHVQEPHQTSLLNPGDLELEDTDVTFTTTPTPPPGCNIPEQPCQAAKKLPRPLHLCTGHD
ncbi:hypothetical protein J4Q44_G00174030 [Coregonus suidteri]|uniref:Uncharacterized protein n=1 Tax=Coregonus suidteri TaxID=861788 RepID=A0AAN8LLM8_9TELE